MRNRKGIVAAALLALGLFCTSPADATILFAANGKLWFTTFFGTVSNSTSAGTFRSAWTSKSLQIQGGSNTDPNANRAYSPTFTSEAVIWVHAQWDGGCSGNTIPTNQQVLTIMGSDGNPAIVIRGLSPTVASEMKISKRSVSGTLTDLVTSSAFFSCGTIGQMDIYLNYAVSGEVSLYWNGTRVAHYTGDVTTDSRTAVNQLMLESGSSNSLQYDSWSEIIVATTDTTAMNLMSLSPVANGATTAWTGTNICSSIWAATNYNDASYGSSNTNNQTQECTVTDTVPAGTYTVLGVGIGARALVGASGPQHIEFVTRLSSTDYLSSDYAPTGVLSNCCQYFQTVNPATSSAWLTSDIPGIQLGLKSTP